MDPAVLDNPNFVNAGSILKDVDLFDASFFGFTPREAESLDPQKRFFLECSWHALEDAGYEPGRYRGSIGVYAGCAMSSYLYELEQNHELMDVLGLIQVHHTGQIATIRRALNAWPPKAGGDTW